MQIGQVAAASGCPVETIRYYERIGLLPRPKRTGSGYRTYAEGDVDRLRFIAHGRALGFSLDEIRSLLGLAEDATLSCADVDRLARTHLGEIRERIAALARMAEELERTIDGCHGGERAHCAILGTLRSPTPAVPSPAQESACLADDLHRRGRGAT
jgi:MerR family transcriptional regulator, mercuric resistance operon regulatory protein